jgi:alpha-N-arabinofuranosidase
MEMYNVHQDATLVPVTVKSNDYVLGAEKLPAVSVSASKDKAGVMHISLTNIDAGKAQDVTIELGKSAYKGVTGRILRSQKLQDHNTFEKPDNIRPAAFTGAAIKGGTLQLTLPAFSVVVLELK